VSIRFPPFFSRNAFLPRVNTLIEVTFPQLNGGRHYSLIKESSAKKRSPMTFDCSYAATPKLIIILFTSFFPVTIFPYSCC